MSKGFIKSYETIYKDENGFERKRTVKKEFVYKMDKNQDPFYMTFINYIKWIYGLTSIVTLKILYKFLEMAEYNTGEFSLNPGRRQQIMDSLGIQSSAFTRSLNQLIESGAVEQQYKTNQKGEIVYKVDTKTGKQIPEYVKGEYRISPQMFWKGELKKRTELTVTFETKYLDEEENSEFE